METFDNNDSDEFVSDIIDELKKSRDEANALQKKQEETPMEKDKLEQFILDKSGTLIQNGVNTVLQLQDRVMNGGNADEICAYSDVVKSVVTCLEALNKIVITDKTVKNKTDLKKMDIEAKFKAIGIDENPTVKSINMTPEQLFRLVKETQDASAKRQKESSKEIDKKE